MISNNQTAWRAAGAAGVLLAVAGCGGESGISTLNLSLTDAPLEGATTVWLQFTGVEIKPAGDGPARAYMFDAPRGFNMLDLQHGNAAVLLEDTEVPAGEYTWIRLLMDPAPNSSYVVDDDGTHGLRIPSGQEVGLRLIRGFTMPDGGRADFTIDFMLDKSIIAPPGQSPNYLMKPVLRMTNNVETGSIEGTFLPGTLAAIPACADVTPTVYLFTGAGVMPDDLYNPLEGPADTRPEVDPLVTANAYLTQAQGYAYRFGFVAAGTYTVAFTCDDDDPAVDEDAVDENDEPLHMPISFSVYPQSVVVAAGQASVANF